MLQEYSTPIRDGSFTACGHDVSYIGAAVGARNLQLRRKVKRLAHVHMLRGRKSSQRAYEVYAGGDSLEGPGLLPLKGAARSLHRVLQLASAFQMLRQRDHHVDVRGRGAPISSAFALRQNPKCDRLRALENERRVVLVAQFHVRACDGGDVDGG
jgi:hypothetical protein